MKKIVAAIGLIIILVGAGVGFMRYQDQQSYQHEIKIAERAVKGQKWKTAQKAYEAAQGKKQTPTTYTALRQLAHIIPAQDDYNHEDWDGAVSQFKLALAIDDGLPLMQKAVKPVLTAAKEKQTAAREASKEAAQAAKASSIARDESRRAKSRASEESSRRAAEKEKKEKEQGEKEHQSDTSPSDKATEKKDAQQEQEDQADS